MTKAAELRAFRTALDNGKFDPAYYLYGSEEYLKARALEELINAAVDPATRAFNLDQLKGGEVHAEALGVMLSTPPMMASRRVVAVRDVEALRKDARTALQHYLASPSADTVLVMVAGVGAKTDKTLAGSATAVEFAPLTGAQLPRWIVRRVAESGGEITDGAVGLLQDIVGGDLSALELEVDKLVSFAGGQRITEDTVSTVVGVRRDETLGHLLDAIAWRETSTALNVLSRVLQQPKTSAVTVVMALTVQMLALAWADARKLHPARLSREYFGLLKEAGGVYTGRSWGEAVAAWSKAAPSWSAQELSNALEALARADEALKTSRLSSDEQLLATLILTVAGPSKHHRTGRK